MGEYVPGTATITCPLHDTCRVDCTSKCGPRSPQEAMQRIADYKALYEGEYYKIQYRTVFNDVSVTPWQDWTPLGSCQTWEDAKAVIEREVGEIHDVSFGQTGLFQSPKSNKVQFRVARTNVHPVGNEWAVGLKNLLGIQ